VAATVVRASFERRKGRAETNVVVVLCCWRVALFNCSLGGQGSCCAAQRRPVTDAPSGFSKFELPRDAGETLADAPKGYNY